MESSAALTQGRAQPRGDAIGFPLGQAGHAKRRCTNPGDRLRGGRAGDWRRVSHRAFRLGQRSDVRASAVATGRRARIARYASQGLEVLVGVHRRQGCAAMGGQRRGGDTAGEKPGREQRIGGRVLLSIPRRGRRGQDSQVNRAGHQVADGEPEVDGLRAGWFGNRGGRGRLDGDVSRGKTSPASTGCQQEFRQAHSGPAKRLEIVPRQRETNPAAPNPEGGTDAGTRQPVDRRGRTAAGPPRVGVGLQAVTKRCRVQRGRSRAVAEAQDTTGDDGHQHAPQQLPHQQRRGFAADRTATGSDPVATG